MKNNTQLKLALTGLAKLQIALNKKGGPGNDSRLFEIILATQDGILKSFGLPSTTLNEKLLWFNYLPTEGQIDERIEQLHKTASEYLLSRPMPELDILKGAQEDAADPFVILPELKIPTHSYTNFIFNKMLLKKKDTLENIWSELQFVNHPDILDVIGRIGMAEFENEAEVVGILKDSGVKYLDQYLMDSSGLFSDDDY